MDPALLIPTPDPLPIHWGWFQVFLFPTFFIHIVLMNVMFGTIFIALVHHVRHRSRPTPLTEAASRNLPFTIAFAVNFGVAPLLFVQVLYGHFIYTSSILMATYWLSVVALVIAAYGLAYIYKDRFEPLGAFRLPVSGLITILLLAVAFIFVNNISLMQDPPSWDRFFDQPGGLLLNLKDPMLVPRYLHFMVGAVAIGGLAIASFFHRRHRQGDPSAAPWIDHGCRWFAYATMVNGVVGLWFLLALPAGLLAITSPYGQFLLLLVGGGAILGAVAVYYGLTCRVIPAIALTLATLFLMLSARSVLRAALLAPWFSLDQLVVQPAISPFLLFVAILIAGLVLIGWMIRFTLRSCAQAKEQP